jgi:hypothetical protein
MHCNFTIWGRLWPFFATMIWIRSDFVKSSAVITHLETRQSNKWMQISEGLRMNAPHLRCCNLPGLV